MPENERVDEQAHEPASADPTELAAMQPLPEQTAPTPRRGIAPVWHTIVFVLAILAFSAWGAVRASSGKLSPLAPVHSPAHEVSNGSDPLRMIRYGLTGALELAAVAWIAFGLRLRKIPFRSLFGKLPSGLNDITKEAGIAAAFWVCSMIVLLCFAFSWDFVQNRIYDLQTAKQSSAPPHAPSTPGKAEPKSPRQQQVEMARQLMELAPANEIEIASWALLCVIVGFSEELIFRGYLQSQCIGWLRAIPFSVLVTSIVFGAAHGYQGLRGICLITVYGALFSSITLLRKNLLPGMLAHGWHDFATGMLLAFIRSTHLLDRLPLSH